MATIALAKHDIRKYRDVIKLNEDNWVDWSDVMLSTLDERGLLGVTDGTAVEPAGTAVLPDVIAAWKDQDTAARNQIILNISPEIRSRVRDAKSAKGVWDKLVEEFESKDPDRVAAVRMKYENLALTEGQRMSEYLDKLNELKETLGRMGDPVSDPSYAYRILRNLPADWVPVAKTIRQISTDPKVVMAKLRAEEISGESNEAIKQVNIEAASQAQALLAHRFGEPAKHALVSNRRSPIPRS